MTTSFATPSFRTEGGTAIMKNRKLMLSIIAASTAAAIGLGSVYAASSAGNEIRTNETETKETGIEIEETEETETETEETESPAESESNSPSILEILTGSDRKNADAEAEAYEDVGVYDGLMMSAADGGNYYAEPAMPNWNTEEYSTVDETGFRDVKLYPLSTFGMDVDTASYALLRRNTLDDTLSWMPKDGVRIEEMINYFNYEYDMPDGDETFSITAQIADCPWNDQTKLMLVGLQAKDIPQEAIKDQNLVFLVDTSGSMYDADKLPLAVEALKYLLTEMDENDSIAIVTYAGSSEIALDPTKCTKEGKAQIIRTLDALTANGGTYGEAGIRTAYDLAQESFVEGGNNRVLLLTDGDFNLGQTDDSELVDLVQEKAEGQIFLSILGFGSGNYNDALAEQLADKGNGNYSYIDSDMEARRVMGAALKGTLNTVAKDAKVQVDFNPAYIKGYRLVGYENRMMNAEDFEDDTKDGGEVGAGQQVTVLYELVTTDSDMELPTAHSRYEQNADGTEDSAVKAEDLAANADDIAVKAEDSAASAGTTAADNTKKMTTLAIVGSETEQDGQVTDSPEQDEVQPTAPSDKEYLTVSIRYKDPEAEKSQLKELAVTADQELTQMSDNMSWAAGVAQIGMLLRESEFAGSSDYDEVRSRMQELTGDDEYREEFIYLINRLKGVKLEDPDYGYDADNYYEEW